MGSDLFGFSGLKVALGEIFSKGISTWFPGWLLGFWHFLVKLDQQASVFVVSFLQKFAFFPDLFAIEVSVAFFFFLFLCFFWRKSVYIMTGVFVYYLFSFYS